MASDDIAHQQYRLTDIPVDDVWVRKHNETLAEVRRLQWSAALLAVIVLAAAVGLLVYSGWASWAWIVAVMLGMFGLGCAAMIVYLPRRMGSMQHTYSTSELIPAVVAEVRPRGVTLLALADRAVDRSAGRMPVLVSRSCEKLPGHEHEVGHRVPCVAVVGNRSARGRDNTYQFVSPLPITWATSDAEVLRRCADEIPEREWDTLRRSIGRLPEVEATPTRLLPLD